MTSENTDNSRTGEAESRCRYLADQSREEEIVESIQQAAEIAGEPLRQSEYEQVRKQHNLDILTLSMILHKNDSWIDVCQQAGVVGEVGRLPDFNADDIVSAIQQAAEEKGEPLSQANYKEWRNSSDSPKPHPSTIAAGDIFEGWIEACEAAGVKHGVMAYNREETISAIQQAAAEKGEPLSDKDYHEWSTSTDQAVPAISTIKHGVIGSWTEACNAAGIKPGKPQYRTEEIISIIQQAADQVGEPLIIAKYDKWRKSVDRPAPSTTYIYHELGQWTAACEAAGVEHGKSTENE